MGLFPSSLDLDGKKKKLQRQSSSFRRTALSFSLSFFFSPSFWLILRTTPRP